MYKMLAVRVCECDGMQEHAEFRKSNYEFSNGKSELLPEVCPENDLNTSELYLQFKPILRTFEADENWTMFACYSGSIAEVRPGLYFYSFGDIDEVGERNFYIQGELRKIIEMLLEEWGPSAPPWRTFLNNIGRSGYPKGYQPGSMVQATTFFPAINEPTLTVGFSYNLENQELHRILRELS